MAEPTIIAIVSAAVALLNLVATLKIRVAVLEAISRLDDKYVRKDICAVRHGDDCAVRGPITPLRESPARGPAN